MKKTAIIILIVLVILGIVLVVLPKNNQNETIEDNVREETSGEVIETNVDIADEYYTPENWDEMWEQLRDYSIREAKAEELNENGWLSGDEIDKLDYFEGLDYQQIPRKNAEKELVYTTNFKYIFRTSEWEEIIPVINIDSEDAQKMNDMIRFSLTDYYSIDYSVSLTEDILSIIIAGDAEEAVSYEMYKINIYTGERVR